MIKFLKNWKLKDSITLLRVFIGWHFLFEGVVKLYNPSWTALGYLGSAQGFLKQFYLLLANESIIGVIDVMNIAALIVVGLTLLLGFYEKLGALVGIGLLLMYYFAHPPFPWLQQFNVEGNYWFINKNLIELVACMIIFQFPTGQFFGLKRLFNKNKANS